LQPVVFPLKPTQHQLRVVLEACLWEHQGQRTGGMWSGLLLLSVMLSMADPTVRMTFLAGIPGEVLLRLLGEVAAGEEGAAPAQADIAGPGASRPAAKAGFMQWPSGCGALGLTAVLDQLGVAGVAIPTRQSVLQVLLWCFFEVASPQQQKQQDDSTTTTSSSSSSPPELSPEHTQELQVAAQQGALWSSSQGEMPAAQLPPACTLPGFAFLLPPPCGHACVCLTATWHSRSTVCVHQHEQHFRLVCCRMQLSTTWTF
jgi:hypothetical protein